MFPATPSNMDLMVTSVSPIIETFGLGEFDCASKVAISDKSSLCFTDSNCNLSIELINNAIDSTITDA